MKSSQIEQLYCRNEAYQKISVVKIRFLLINYKIIP
jgi:hypothetical protein